MEKKIEGIIETLSPIERQIIPFLDKSIKDIEEKSGLDRTSIMRALSFLENKNIIKLSREEKIFIDLGDNGVRYKKSGLPERILLNFLDKQKSSLINEAQKQLKLSDNEIKAAIGALKRKALIELKGDKIIFTGNKEEIAKKSLEEKFLEQLPIEQEKLQPEQLFALKSLENRKEIIKKIKETQIKLELTGLGKEIIKQDISKLSLIEELTPDIIKNESWKGKKFRKYDIKSPLPKISGGKKHFVNQAIEKARRIWTEMGFKEMTGTLTQTGFWNFDALFTAQDHPVREIQDTFYIKDIKGKLPDKYLVKAVKQAHESGVEGSRGWRYSWSEEEAKKVVLRTHTTCLSAQTLAKLRDLKDKSGKFFAIGMNFRNETVDASHGFQFNQTEGIVVDRQANFKHLLGYMKAFLNKMGFEKVRFRPHFFPYTEPSVEADVYDEKTKKWTEVLGSGIFRPEVVVPLLGEYVPVLAWGMGFDRLIMKNYDIKDLRELYKNDLTKLREIKYDIAK